MNKITNFLNFAESLKLIRKAKIEEFVCDKNIDDIYTDLLPNNGIINKVNLPRTTILVGRKGTGKSTIFQKSQKDLISNKRCVSIYIDVKSLYDNSSPAIPQEAIGLGNELKKYLLYSNLIKEIIIETRHRLDDFVEKSVLNKMFGLDSTQIEQISKKLDEIEDSITDVVKTVDCSLIKNFKETKEDSCTNKSAIDLKLSKNPSAGASFNGTSSNNHKLEFEATFLNYFDIKNSLTKQLKQIRDILKIDHLYIFLDDFSEIDENAQKIFMDWFVAPLNNSSDDFIKFKIAIYPHRFYYGELDNSKIDEISLEFFEAFYSFEANVDISRIEFLALSYTERLIEKRFKLFFPDNFIEDFFSISKSELYNLLFSVSFNNPRKIGYILSYCQESCLIYDQKISKEAIENASKKYYTDVTLKYFLINQFVTRPFGDKISNEHQYKLLNRIIERQKINGSKENRSRMKGKPSNHFTIRNDIAYLVENLELNGFITTYNKVSENNTLSIIYSLDYGLCKNNSINFERAYNKKYMKYYSNARFNMNVLISDYFNTTQIIKCSNGHELEYEMLPMLKQYMMSCPKCMQEGKVGICKVESSNTELIQKLSLLEKKRQYEISFPEFLILEYLYKFSKTVSIQKISNATDMSISTAKNRINRLEERGLVKQDTEAGILLDKYLYLITEAGKVIVDKVYLLIETRVETQKD